MSPSPKIPKVWQTPRFIRCRAYNPPLQWQVQSESQPKQPHLVDLGAYAGNGACSCTDFLCRKEPELRQGRRPSPATRCKHIKAAREALLNRAIREMTENQKQPDQK